MAYGLTIGTERANALQNAIQEELLKRELSPDADPVMAEYITIMVINDKTPAQITAELTDLIGADFDSSFVDWLFAEVEKSAPGAETPQIPPPEPIPSTPSPAISRDRDPPPHNPSDHPRRPQNAPRPPAPLYQQAISQAIPSSSPNDRKRTRSSSPSHSTKARRLDVPTGPRAMFREGNNSGGPGERGQRSLLDRVGPMRNGSGGPHGGHQPFVKDEIQARIDNITGGPPHGGPDMSPVMLPPGGPPPPGGFPPMNGMPGVDMNAMAGMANPLMLQEMMMSQMALMSQMAGAMGLLNPAMMGGGYPMGPQQQQPQQQGGMGGDMGGFNGGMNGGMDSHRGRGRGRGGPGGGRGMGRGRGGNPPNSTHHSQSQQQNQNANTEQGVQQPSVNATGPASSSPGKSSTNGNPPVVATPTPSVAPSSTPNPASATSSSSSSTITASSTNVAQSTPVAAASTAPAARPGFAPPDRPQSPTLCKFGLKCSNAMCRWSHPSPVATPESGVVLSNDPCENGRNCKDKDCIKAHVSPAVLNPNAAEFKPTHHYTPPPTQTSQSQIPCRFGLQCTRPGCIYVHPTRSSHSHPHNSSHSYSSTQSQQVPCRFGAGCTRATCTFQHPEGRVLPGSFHRGLSTSGPIVNVPTPETGSIGGPSPHRSMTFRNPSNGQAGTKEELERKVKEMEEMKEAVKKAKAQQQQTQTQGKDDGSKSVSIAA